jgi:hypothetical protein
MSNSITSDLLLKKEKLRNLQKVLEDYNRNNIDYGLNYNARNLVNEISILTHVGEKYDSYVNLTKYLFTRFKNINGILSEMKIQLETFRDGIKTNEQLKIISFAYNSYNERFVDLIQTSYFNNKKIIYNEGNQLYEYLDLGSENNKIIYFLDINPHNKILLSGSNKGFVFQNINYNTDKETIYNYTLFLNECIVFVINKQAELKTLIDLLTTLFNQNETDKLNLDNNLNTYKQQILTNIERDYDTLTYEIMELEKKLRTN